MSFVSSVMFMVELGHSFKTIKEDKLQSRGPLQHDMSQQLFILQ
jgi:hypothetical protein